MNSFFNSTRSALKARALRVCLQSYGFVAYSDVSDGLISAWGLHSMNRDVDILVSMPECTPLAEGYRYIDREMCHLAEFITSWSDDYEDDED